jgi:hypothetical protein
MNPNPAIAGELLVGRYGWFMYGYWDHNADRLSGMRLTVTNRRIIFRAFIILDQFEIALDNVQYAEALFRTLLWPFPAIRIHYRFQGESQIFTFCMLRQGRAKLLLEKAGVRFHR